MRYCYACGGRLIAPGGPPPETATVVMASQPDGRAVAPPSQTRVLSAGASLGTPQGSGGTPAPDSPSPPQPRARNLAGAGWRAVCCVFLHLRGRIDADKRRRELLYRNQAAHQQLDALLFAVGEGAVAAPLEPGSPLDGLISELRAAARQHERAITELAATAQRQAADDLRLGIEQSRAETEWNACHEGGAALDVQLEALAASSKNREDDHAQPPPDAARGFNGQGDQALRSTALAPVDRGAEYRALRERAAALRASTVAARSRLEQVSAARRRAATVAATNIATFQRERAEAELAVRRLTVEIGRRACHLGLPGASFSSLYGQVHGLQATLVKQEGQLAALQGSGGASASKEDSSDARQLAIGLAILAFAAAALSAAAWVLLGHIK